MKNLISKYALALISIAVVFYSCGEGTFSTTLEIEPPIHDPMMATHAYLNYDEGLFDASVTKTVSIVEPNGSNIFENYLNNAEITLVDGLGNLFIIPNDSESYTNYSASNLLLSAGMIKLEIDSPSFDNPSIANSYIPSKITILSSSFLEDGGVDLDGKDRSAIEIEFNDPIDEENFYEATIYIVRLSGIDAYKDFEFTDSNDPIVEKGYDRSSVIISDASFNGERKKIKLLMFQTQESEVEGRLFVQWRNITKEYFQFTKTLHQYSDQKDNPFLTPVQIYSNMENGIGIFSVFRQEEVTVF